MIKLKEGDKVQITFNATVEEVWPGGDYWIRLNHGDNTGTHHRSGIPIFLSEHNVDGHAVEHQAEVLSILESIRKQEK